MALPMLHDTSHYAVVTAMITPAFFLTATSSLLATSNARLARVVDRMRADLAELKNVAIGQSREVLARRVGIHRRRSTLVLVSLRLLYGAVSAFVGTSLGIAIDSFIGYRIGALPTLLAVVGVLLMLVASICLGLEARLGVRMLDEELDQELARLPPTQVTGAPRGRS